MNIASIAHDTQIKCKNRKFEQHKAEVPEDCHDGKPVYEGVLIKQEIVSHSLIPCWYAQTIMYSWETLLVMDANTDAKSAGARSKLAALKATTIAAAMKHI